MPPKKRIKEIIIKKKVDDVLKLHFNDTILNLNLPKIKKLYNTGVINNQMFQFLKAVQSYQQKENEGKYELSDLECSDLAANIINLPSWNTQSNTSGQMIQSWRPGEERSKVFTGNKVLITRELSISTPIDNESLNNSIGTLNYRVEWGSENKHWLSIDLTAEAHSWCEQII